MSGIDLNRKDKHLRWATVRSILELDSIKHKINGKKSRSHWSTFEKILKFATFFLKNFGFHRRGKKNALDLSLNEIDLFFDNLPKEFDGFSILHLSDLHVDGLPEITDAILKKVSDQEYDLCVITGDFRYETRGMYKQIIEPLKKITLNIVSKNGILAVLGNHDTWRITEFAQELGVHFLINESISIAKGKNQITVTGTDDPFKYFTEDQVEALEEPTESFKIALVHTSELSKVAAERNYKLYLCGHTHGGQICLPGGIPLITHQYEGRKYFRGIWHLNGMTGFTSQGCGVSGMPIRFFSRGEIVKINLRKRTPASI